MFTYRNLTTVCCAAVLAFGLAACGSSSDDDTAMVEPPAMPEPMPDPGPTDLEATQMAAKAAATAAMTASTNAAMSADSAAEATMTLATLQTGADSNSGEMGGREAAYAAHAAATAAADAATEAAAAYAAAAAATTGDAGEEAWRMAVAAQEAAEAAAATAASMAEAAIEAAMSELHIAGTVKSVDILDEDGMVTGESSIDADMGMLTKTADDGSVTITGFQDDVERAGGRVMGQAFVHGADPDDDKPYKQTVEARDVAIGKTLDTTDDAARLTVIHSRAGSTAYRVFIDSGDLIDGAAVAADGKVTIDIGGTATAVTLTPLGMFIEATAADPAPTDPTPAKTEGALHYTDIVHAKLGANDAARMEDTAKDNKPVMVYSYPGADGAVYVVEVERVVTAAGVTTSIDLQPVDITALAAPDIARDVDVTAEAGPHEEVGVKASVPTAKAYSHIHFGVWAGLGAATKTGAQKLSGLGIGFVQSIGDGPTERLGIGTATYKGDWVAVVQRQNSQGEGAFNMRDGAATLTANFDKDEFEADLDTLAVLEGTLDGNGFSGTTVTVDRTNADLNATGDFKGEFSGGIYGEKGTEAAGVFDFAGGEDGSFRGAFGGTNQK